MSKQIIFSGKPEVATIFDNVTKEYFVVGTPEFVTFMNLPRVRRVSVENCGDFESHLFCMRKMADNQWLAFNAEYTGAIVIKETEHITERSIWSVSSRLKGTNKKFFALALLHKIYLAIFYEIFN